MLRRFLGFARITILCTSLAACGSSTTSAVRLVYQAPAGLAFSTQTGGSPQPFPVSGLIHPHHPDLSATTGQIVFVVDEPGGPSDVWIAEADGTHARVLVSCTSPCEVAEDPAWSPDGSRIAYWTWDGVTEAIHVLDLASGDVIATMPAEAGIGPAVPRWSPDGHHLVVEVGRYDLTTNELLASWLATIDLAAQPLEMQPITTDTMVATYPDWSWATDRIVFQAGNAAPFAHAGQPTTLYTISPDGSDLAPITSRAASAPWLALPAWTADGQHILATLIHSTSHFTIGSVAMDGIVTELLDSDGAALEGAHPRVAGR
jgi:TolB protein